MTMHAVLGDGSMTRKELTETLNDLLKADEKDKQTFWFLLQGKPEPTDTDKWLVDWLHKQEVYYEVITDDESAMDKAVYAQPQSVHTAKRLAPAVVKLLGSRPEEDEPAELLALFYNTDDAGAPEDQWLNTVCQAVFDAGFPIRALNDGLVVIDLGPEVPEEGAPAAEPEPTPAPAPAKSVAKKAARAPAAAPAETPVSAAEPSGAPSPNGDTVYTREQLENVELEELKAIAGGKGLALAPRTRMSTYIEAILQAQQGESPAVGTGEVETEAPTLGAHGLDGLDVDEFAGAVATAVVNHLREMKLIISL